MKPITWKLVFNMDKQNIYVGWGRPPYKRLSIDRFISVEPTDQLQRKAQEKLMSMMLDAICNN